MRLYSVLFFVLAVFAFTIGICGGTLSGKIYDKQGRPVNEAPVQIQKINSKHRSFSYTRRDGSFSFKKLPRGQYIIRTYVGNKKIQRKVLVEQTPIKIQLKMK